jgi:hypothetical protein
MCVAAYRGFDLSDKIVLVAGGSSGIGPGMAEALAQAGADRGGYSLFRTRSLSSPPAVVPARFRRHPPATVTSLWVPA